MRRGRATLATLALILLSVLFAGPAQAGGPTSVLLVVPGVGHTASLYSSDADYNSLAALVGAFGGSDATGHVDRSGASHEAGAGVTVTWLIHDVQVWRVDRIYVVGDGKPWIMSQVVEGGTGGVWDSPAVWHTATDSRELTTLLDRLGVNPAQAGADNVAAGGPLPSAAPLPSTAPAAGARPSVATKGRSAPGSASLALGVAGLALGAAITVLVLRLLPRAQRIVGRGSTVESPAPDETDPADDRTWSSSEELSWPTRR
jgi:hypothetical protein